MERRDWRSLGFVCSVLCWVVWSGPLGPRAACAEAAAVAQARSAHWTGSYLANEDSVRELAERGEPTAARAVLGALASANDPRVRMLAMALTYQHAARLGVDATARGRRRGELVAVAEDKNASGYAREQACRVLLTEDWSGRDAWYE